jgi:NADPH:quinone reductase-like Zn-dependent oxidoreductase
MKAAVIHEFGPPSVLRYEDVATPEPGPGEVQLKILAAGLNRLDIYLREGSVLPSFPWPHILGSDASAEVSALGAGTSRFKIGDRVIPMPGYPFAPEDRPFSPMSAAPSYALRGIGAWGTYAEYMTIPEHWVVKDETGLTPELVATLPMPIVTGVRAVKVVGEVKAGHHVLVHGGASGTGSMNLQIAKALGAKVAATVRTSAKAEFVRSLGADLVIDMSRDDFVKSVQDWTGGRGCDVVIDNLGGDILGKSLDALRPLGVLVAMGFVAGLDVGFNVRGFFFPQKQVRGSLMGDIDDLNWGLDHVKQGKIKPVLDRTFALKDAAAAHERLGASTGTGTAVLLP